MANKTVSHSQFLSLVYHDLFDYPLTNDELWLWQVGKDKTPRHQIESLGTFNFLPGRKDILIKRAGLVEANGERWGMAFKIAAVLKFIPTVEMVGIAGLLSARGTRDGFQGLILVASAKTLWATKAVALLLMGILGKREMLFVACVDLNNLAFADRNIYTAHEVLQGKVLFDRGGVYKKLLQENRWAEQFFPNAFKKYWEQSKKRRKRVSLISTLFKVMFKAVERPACFFQIKGENMATRDRTRARFGFWRTLVPEVFLARLERISKGELIAKPGEFID